MAIKYKPKYWAHMTKKEQNNYLKGNLTNGQFRKIKRRANLDTGVSEPSNHGEARDMLIRRFKCDHFISTIALATLLAESLDVPAPTNETEAKTLIRLNHGKVKATKKPVVVRRGKQTPADDFYQSRAWRDLRYIALRNSEGRCGCCGATAADGVQIHVDHIKPRSRFPELALDLDNLQILCDDCNIGKSNVFYDDWRLPK